MSAPLADFLVGKEEWTEDAACKGMDTRIFFPERGQSTAPAGRVCARCPVRDECDEYRHRTGTEHGIWGGFMQSRGKFTDIIPEDEPLKLTSLSASSAQVYEECPARWAVEIRDRMPQQGNSAAHLGTACHEAFDDFVKQGWHLRPMGEQEQAIVQLYDHHYHNLFSNTARYAEGKEMVLRWVRRQDWTGRTVISAEEKKSFPLKTNAGDIEFRYIMDRKDRLDNGEIEVIDYKSLIKPLSPDQLRHRIQTRAYALAAQREHPEAERIWVTFDMLRYEPVGVVFTKEENRATWVYLHNLANRILADQTAEEKLGPGCKWCVRSHVCKTLRKHIDLGGIMGIGTLEEAAGLLLEVQSQREGLDSLERKLTEQVDAFMEADQMVEWEGEELTVKYKASGRRHIDAERLRQVVGDHIFAKYGAARISGVDEMLASDELDSDTKSKVRQLIRKNYGDPKPVVVRKDPFQ